MLPNFTFILADMLRALKNIHAREIKGLYDEDNCNNNTATIFDRIAVYFQANIC
jgi:hypothetical protein